MTQAEKIILRINTILREKLYDNPDALIVLLIESTQKQLKEEIKKALT